MACLFIGRCMYDFFFWEFNMICLYLRQLIFVCLSVQLFFPHLSLFFMCSCLGRGVVPFSIIESILLYLSAGFFGCLLYRMATGQLFSQTTQALFYNYKQLPIQRMLDFDFLCGVYNYSSCCLQTTFNFGSQCMHSYNVAFIIG